MYIHARVQFVGYFDFRYSSGKICGVDHGRGKLVSRGVVITSTNTGTRSENGTSEEKSACTTWYWWKKANHLVLALPVLDLHYWCRDQGAICWQHDAPISSARYWRKGAYHFVITLPVLEVHYWCSRPGNDTLATGASCRRRGRPDSA